LLRWLMIQAAAALPGFSFSIADIDSVMSMASAVQPATAVLSCCPGDNHALEPSSVAADGRLGVASVLGSVVVLPVVAIKMTDKTAERQRQHGDSFRRVGVQASAAGAQPLFAVELQQTQVPAIRQVQGLILMSHTTTSCQRRCLGRPDVQYSTVKCFVLVAAARPQLLLFS
jgi:hypothetical protein